MEDLIYRATLAEQTERWEDLVSTMKEITQQAVGLPSDLRSLLSTGYKNVVSMRRVSWRTVRSLEAMETARNRLDKAELAGMYREKIEKELVSIYSDSFSLLNLILTTKSNSEEAQVSFLTMQADHYRYLAELQAKQEANSAIESALRVYQQATDLANAALPPTLPTRLDLALHFAVFLYEVMEQQEEACSKVKSAFLQATEGLEGLGEEQYMKSCMVLLLLRDYFHLWTSGPPSNSP